MNETEVCPNCKFECEVERYGFGECSNCKKMKWIWTSTSEYYEEENIEEEYEYYEWEEND